jgi:hypothetical protein
MKKYASFNCRYYRRKQGLVRWKNKNFYKIVHIFAKMAFSGLKNTLIFCRHTAFRTFDRPVCILPGIIGAFSGFLWYADKDGIRLLLKSAGQPVKSKAAIPPERNRMAQKILKTSAEGRVCQYPQCNRLLSIYNHETYCRVHLEMMSDRNKVKPHECKFR